MTGKFGRLWYAVVALMVGASSVVCAQQSGSDMQSAPSRDPGMSGRKGGMARQGKMKPGMPLMQSNTDLCVHADFIWWNAVQEGTQFAQGGYLFRGASSGSNGGPPLVSETPVQALPGKMAQIGTEWAPGFKVGIGMNLPHDSWDLCLQYTWLRPRNRDRMDAPEGTFSSSDSDSGNGPQPLYRVGAPGVGDGDRINWQPTDEKPPRPGYALRKEAAWPLVQLEGDSIQSDWKLDFNVMDLEIGKRLRSVGNSLKARLFGGLKSAWQRQVMHTEVNRDYFPRLLGELNLGDDGSVAGHKVVSGPYRRSDKNDNWGIGARGGVGLNWCVMQDWSIYTRAACTSMWTSYYDVRRKDVVYDKVADAEGKEALQPSAVPIDMSMSKHYAVKGIMEAELGVCWAHVFADGDYRIALQAGWEAQIWHNWGVRVTSSGTGPVWNDLSFHGLRIGGRFDF
ncbi:MAG: Lpg1974 family pore-forming outer membrane protein [Simkaniaceae bacterium]|nr:Lpg1974 family pore-forming outer membrane protein [Simkaniaceae bacterium]